MTPLLLRQTFARIARPVGPRITSPVREFNMLALGLTGETIWYHSTLVSNEIRSLGRVEDEIRVSLGSDEEARSNIGSRGAE